LDLREKQRSEDTYADDSCLQNKLPTIFACTSKVTILLFTKSLCYTPYMPKIKFTWEPAKAEKNIVKYDVSFEEAATIFKDPLALFYDDVEHSQKEKREFAIGRSTTRERLLTCFIARTEGIVRIISARTSTHRERQEYDENAEIK